MIADELGTDDIRRTWRHLCDLLRTEGDRILAANGVSNLERVEDLRFFTRVATAALQGRLEFADPDFPVFYRDGDDRLNYGYHNVDNTYMRAQLHGDCTYQLHGEPNGREFAIGTSVGDSSQVLRDHRLGERWSRDINTQPDGSFDMLLSAVEQPGNWLPLRPGHPCVVGIRQYFIDWTDRAIPGFFYVTRVDGPAAPAPVSVERFLGQLDDATGWLERAVKFWMGYGNLREPRPETTNIIPKPTVTSASTSNVAYGIGHFELEPEEALLVELQPPDTPYWGFNIYNSWGAAPDFLNRPSSLNCNQAYADSDKKVRIVISHRDLGHPNWLDTGGYRRGVVWYRWLVFEGDQPGPATKVVRAHELWDHVPADTPRVGEPDRRQQLALRRRHLTRRFQR